MNKQNKKNSNNSNKKTNVFLNENIPFDDILLIIDNKAEKTTKQNALEIADKEGVDLLCVSPNSNPPVCKLVDYKKLIFIEQKNKKKIKKDEEKELRISQNIAEHDLNLKLNKVYEWIKTKKASVKFEIKLIKKENKQIEIVNNKCKQIIETIKEKLPNIELRKDIHIRGRNICFTIINSNKK